MPKARLEFLKPGMMVTADIKNMDDMLLIPAGCTLTEKHINILQSWGIPEVQVETSGAAEDGCDPLQHLDPGVLAEITAELKEKYWHFDETNQVEVEVFNLILRRKARQLAGK